MESFCKRLCYCNDSFATSLVSCQSSKCFITLSRYDNYFSYCVTGVMVIKIVESDYMLSLLYKYFTVLSRRKNQSLLNFLYSPLSMYEI